MLRKLSVVIVCLFVASCKTMDNIDAKFDPAKLVDSGIVVMSVSQDDPGGLSDMVFKYWMDSGNKFEEKIIESKEKPGAASLLMLPTYNESDFEDVYGRIVVIKLKAGKHEFSRWTAQYRHNFFFEPKVASSPLYFEVEPGAIQYLGNLHARIYSYSEGSMGFRFPQEVAPEINDMSERDIAVFKKRYPNLSDKEIAQTLLSQGPWMADGQE